MQQPINPILNTITSSLFRVSAKLLVFQNNKLLLVHEPEGWFGLPGGGVDHGESVIHGLMREIEEELGYAVDPSTISPLPIIVDSTAIFDQIPRLTLFYRLTHDAPVFAPRHLELDYAWKSIDELQSIELGPNIACVRDDIIEIIEVSTDAS